MIGGMTHYQVLGVPESADPATLRRAYRRLVKRWHPDVCTSPSAVGYFRRIDDAYRTLIDPMQRVTYDQALQWQRSRAEMGTYCRGWAAEPHRADPPRTWTPPTASDAAGADRPDAPSQASADHASSPHRSLHSAGKHGGRTLFWLVTLAVVVGLTRLALWPPRQDSDLDNTLRAYQADVRLRAVAPRAKHTPARPGHGDSHAILPRGYVPVAIPYSTDRPDAADDSARPDHPDPKAGPFSPPPSVPKADPAPRAVKSRPQAKADNRADTLRIASPMEPAQSAQALGH